MHQGGFSLIRLFTSFAMLGAEWVMWVLVALSVASVAVMLERGRYYHSLNDDLERLGDEVRALLRKGDLAGARSRLERSASPAAVVAIAGLAESESGLKSADEAMQGATTRVRLNLERYLAFLGTVGNNAPFVGLFGTVIGIIQAFDKLRAGETAARDLAHRAAQAGAAAAPALDTGAVMGSLAEALVATAIGLFVAIPAVAAYNFFQRRVRTLVASTDTLSHVVLAGLAATPVSEPVKPAADKKPAAEKKSAEAKD